MSLFNEKNVTIHDGTFIEATNYFEHTERKQKGLKLLRINVAPGALHNSGERFNPPKCHPNTRTAVLDRINAWANIQIIEGVNTTDPRPILWLSGPAGAGKSAIAQTLAEQWYAEGKLAASFFFSRTAINRNEKTFLVPTVAYQLHCAFPGIRSSMERVLEEDPLILTKSLATQMEALIVRPCSRSGSGFPKVIILDGLDECYGEGAQGDILSAFSFLIRRSHMPFLLLVASRPEYDIRRAFSGPDLGELTNGITLDDGYNPDTDIELYLRCKLDEVKAIHRVDDPYWPPEQAIRDLVRKSSGQFIYPSTVVKYIGGLRGDPRRCLEVVLGIQDAGQDKPYAQLDALYMFILSTIDPASYEAAMDIFAILTTGLRNIWAWSHGPGVTFFMLKQVLFMDSVQLHRHLIDLHSILHVPPEDDHQREQGDHIRFFHASFGDFLSDRRRAQRFFLGRKEASTRVAFYLFKHILEGMSSGVITRATPVRGWGYWRELEHNLCKYLRDADVSDRLKIGLELAMEEHGDGYYRYLQGEGLQQTKPREALFEFLGDCDLKLEILWYIKCYGWRNPDFPELLPSKFRGCAASRTSTTFSQLCQDADDGPKGRDRLSEAVDEKGKAEFARKAENARLLAEEGAQAPGVKAPPKA